MKQLLISLVLVFMLFSLNAQMLPRKATMGLLAKPVANGIIVDSVVGNASFAALDLQKGDIITDINGNKITSMETYGRNVSG